jgi:hypothetical protein
MIDALSPDGVWRIEHRSRDRDDLFDSDTRNEYSVVHVPTGGVVRTFIGTENWSASGLFERGAASVRFGEDGRSVVVTDHQGTEERFRLEPPAS